MVQRLDLSSLREAFATFDASLLIVNEHAWFNRQTNAVRNTLIAGAIQNFEFVYELGMKMLRRQLELESTSPSEVDESSFRDLLCLAGQKGLIGNAESKLPWRVDVIDWTSASEEFQRIIERDKIVVHPAQ